MLLTGKLNSSPSFRNCKKPINIYKRKNVAVEIATSGKEDMKTTSKFESLAGTKAVPR